MNRRKESQGHHSGAGLFAGRIVCGECGAFYGEKKWHSTDEHSHTVQDQDEYARRYDSLAELRGQDGIITEFDERLWHSLVEKVTVFAKDDIRFTFKDGSVISA
jgi:hypothetical protein